MVIFTGLRGGADRVEKHLEKIDNLVEVGQRPFRQFELRLGELPTGPVGDVPPFAAGPAPRGFLETLGIRDGLQALVGRERRLADDLVDLVLDRAPLLPFLEVEAELLGVAHPAGDVAAFVHDGNPAILDRPGFPHATHGRRPRLDELDLAERVGGRGIANIRPPPGLQAVHHPGPHIRGAIGLDRRSFPGVALPSLFAESALSRAHEALETGDRGEAEFLFHLVSRQQRLELVIAQSRQVAVAPTRRGRRVLAMGGDGHDREDQRRHDGDRPVDELARIVFCPAHHDLPIESSET